MENTLSDKPDTGARQTDRKPYHSPRLMVLGAIDSVVLISSHIGNDGNGPPSSGS